MNYKIVPINGKLIVYINGKLHCIAHNIHEADKEIRNYSKAI